MGSLAFRNGSRTRCTAAGCGANLPPSPRTMCWKTESRLVRRWRRVGWGYGVNLIWRCPTFCRGRVKSESSCELEGEMTKGGVCVCGGVGGSKLSMSQKQLVHKQTECQRLMFGRLPVWSPNVCQFSLHGYYCSYQSTIKQLGQLAVLPWHIPVSFLWKNMPASSSPKPWTAFISAREQIGIEVSVFRARAPELLSIEGQSAAWGGAPGLVNLTEEKVTSPGGQARCAANISPDMMSRDTYVVGEPGNPDVLHGFGACYSAAIIPDWLLCSAPTGATWPFLSLDCLMLCNIFRSWFLSPAYEF